jgi:lysozyme
MRVSRQGIEFIASFEGFVDHPYRDSGGIWTIGYGHTGPGVSSMGTITREKGLRLLASDVRAAEAAVNALPLRFNQNEFDSVASAVFNCGPGVLAPDRSLGKALREHGMAGVPAALALYVRDANGTALAGLVRRRKAEGALFVKPANDGPASWLTPAELRRCRELDQLREQANRTPEQQRRLAALLHALVKQRKRIWRSAQPAPKGDGRGWDHAHRQQRYESLRARTA